MNHNKIRNGIGTSLSSEIRQEDYCEGEVGGRKEVAQKASGIIL